MPTTPAANASVVPAAGAAVVVVITVGDGVVGVGVVGVGVVGVGVVGVGVVGAVALGMNTCVASAMIGTFSAYVDIQNLYGLLAVNLEVTSAGTVIVIGAAAAGASVDVYMNLPVVASMMPHL